MRCVLDAYTGIKIYIRPWSDTLSAYPVEATLDNGAVFKGGHLHLDQRALLIAKNRPEEYGPILFNSLFTGPILQAYHEVTGYAQGRTGGRLHVRLLIDEGAPELHALS